jgi:L-glutamine-phosphate cytidylyltransferase
MRAVILAAGRGSRMGGLTADRPKCLIELGGRTLLERQVAALRAADATEVGVVAGWRAGLFTGSGLTVFRNDDWATTTQVQSLAAADRWLRAGSVLVSYGDIVYSAATARALAAARQDLAVAYDPAWRSLWERRFAAPLADAETFRLDRKGLIADIGGRPTSMDEVRGQYIGLLRWTPTAWATVRDMLRVEPATAGLDMTGLLRFLVRERGFPIGATPVSGPWCEFDQPGDVTVGRSVLAALDELAELDELDGFGTERAA